MVRCEWIVNGLAIDSICPWSRSSPGLKLVLPPRPTDFFIIPWIQLEVNTSEIYCARCDSFGFWNVGIWFHVALDFRAAFSAQFWFAVAWGFVPHIWWVKQQTCWWVNEHHPATGEWIISFNNPKTRESFPTLKQFWMRLASIITSICTKRPSIYPLVI